MAIVTVEVTQADIDTGEQKNCARCPVALAVMRAMPGVEVEVVPGKAWILPPDTPEARRWYDWEPCPLPDKARDFVWRFDQGWVAKPFTFDLEVPDTLVPATV